MRRRKSQSIGLILLLCSLSVAAHGDETARFERTIQLGGLPKDGAPVITAVAIQPNGNLLATAGDDHVVRIWNVTDGRLERTLRGHRDWVTSVAFSSGGDQLITGGRDRRVLIWDVASGEMKGTLGDHRHPISAIVVSDQQDQVAIAGFRAPLKVFDLASAQLLGSLRCPCTDSRAVAFSPDMRLIAAGSRTGKIRVWNLKDGKKRDISSHRGRISAVVFTSNNELLSAGQDIAIHLWNPSTGQRRRTFQSESGKVLAMTALQPNHFATASADNLIRLYRFDSAKPYSVLRGHTGSIAALDFRANKLISGSFDTTVRVWSAFAPDSSRRGTTPTSRLSPVARN